MNMVPTVDVEAIEAMLYWYRAKVIRIVDGDTIEVMWDQGRKTYAKEKLRLWGVDTAEIYGVKKHSAEWEKGMISTRYVRDLLQGKMVYMKTHKDKQGGRGRYLAEIVFEDEDTGNWIDLGELLLHEGLAVKYGG